MAPPPLMQARQGGGGSAPPPPPPGAACHKGVGLAPHIPLPTLQRGGGSATPPLGRHATGTWGGAARPVAQPVKMGWLRHPQEGAAPLRRPGAATCRGRPPRWQPLRGCSRAAGCRRCRPAGGPSNCSRAVACRRAARRARGAAAAARYRGCPTALGGDDSATAAPARPTPRRLPLLPPT